MRSPNSRSPPKGVGGAIVKFLEDFDVFRDSEGRSYHIKAKRGELFGYVLTAGSPERVAMASEFLEGARLVSSNRGLLVYVGHYKGAPVTLHCTGMGPGSAEIAFTELIFNIDLVRFARPTIIRAGTAGSWRKEVKPGDIVVETAVVRFNGTSYKIAPEGWPAATDLLTTLALAETAAKLGIDEKVWFAKGICKDSLYADEKPLKRSAVPASVEEAQRAFEELGAASTSMESAPMAVLVDFYNKKLADYGAGVRLAYASALLVISPHYREAADVEFEVSEEAERVLVEFVLEALKRKWELDRRYVGGDESVPPLDANAAFLVLYSRTL